MRKGEKKKGPISKKETTPKSANVQTRAAKENNMDMPNRRRKGGK